jgi:hypothetical protein
MHRSWWSRESIFLGQWALSRWWGQNFGWVLSTATLVLLLPSQSKVRPSEEFLSIYSYIPVLHQGSQFLFWVYPTSLSNMLQVAGVQVPTWQDHIPEFQGVWRSLVSWQLQSPAFDCWPYPSCFRETHGETPNVIIFHDVALRSRKIWKI